MKPTFITALAVLLPLFSQAQKKLPNIVFILADDLGYGDVSALNNASKIRTPNIDGLAKRGVIFTDAHSSSSVSTPTRYGILTGRYNWRSTLKQGVLSCFDAPIISPERTTMASMLRNCGYSTACIGKWHLGLKYQTTDGKAPVDSKDRCNVDYSKPIAGGPLELGFDYFFGMNAPNYAPYCFIENRHTLGVPSVFYPVNPAMDCRAGRGVPDWKYEDVLPKMEEAAVKYIQESSSAGRPFFLYMPLMSPHTPIAPTAEFRGKSGLNKYADFVMQTDAVVGNIVAMLETAGVVDNTIVVFTSDNGCSPKADFSFLGVRGHNPSYIYRGHKADLFEGGHRVPCIVSWPRKITAHTVTQPVCLTDFMATFAGLCGYDLKDNEGEDSYNILPLIEKRDYKRSIREAVVHHSIAGHFSIRQGDWKLLLSNNSGGWSFPRPGKDLEAVKDAPKYQLYNLKNDPGETRDCSPENGEKVSELRALMVQYIKNGRSTKGEPQKNEQGKSWKQLDYFME